MSRQRNITVSVDGALPIDGYKAMLQRVGEYEKRIADGENIPAIDSTAGGQPIKHVCTSLKAYEVYVLDLVDFNPELGDYAFEVVEIGPA